MSKDWKVPVSLVAIAVLVIAGCAKEPAPEAPKVSEEAEVASAPVAPMVAVATMASRADLAIVGSISFTQSGPDAPTAVAAHFEGVGEGLLGLHGLHVHEIGDCSSEDFKSAGGHFNPMEVPHGGPEDAERHAGDLGNIECDQDGVCHLEIETSGLTVEDGPESVVGRAVILHEKTDDLVSQPTGAAGARLACGVIERIE
jgi:Cu-Zn family superoxide dismutase